MNEDLEAYLEIIDQLLACSSGDEVEKTLNAHPDLMNAELVQVMQQRTEILVQNGNQIEADFLRDISHQLAAVVFLVQILKITADSRGDTQVVYPLLQANVDKLDSTLVGELRAWATQKISELQPGEQQYVASTIEQFSNLIQEFPLGDKASNIEIAIAGHEVVLTVFTRTAFPEEWAIAQNNLGAAYGNRIRGDRAENIEKEIATYTEVLQVHTYEASPQEWAMLQNNLGLAYSRRIRGDRTKNIEMAIVACNKALQVYIPEAFPKKWATAQNNLGLAYSRRIRGDRAENIEMAIAAYNKALRVYTREAFPHDWAMVLINLSAAYSCRIQGDRAENIEMAIAACNKALQVYIPETFPQEWAMTQNNLGLAYGNRVQGERAENIEMAIAAYNKALQVYTREAFPHDWAMVQSSLGSTYGDRIRGNRAENLEVAIAAYNKALQVYTREAFPHDWAMVQSGLGATYRDRIWGDQAKNLGMAIAAYNKALQVCTYEAFPQDWAGIQNNLGLSERLKVQGDRAENLEMAIAAYNKALQVYTPEAFPQEWAMTQNNLGVAYLNRIQGDRAENLEMAIAAYNKALTVRTRKASPHDWAMTQNNLGAAYLNRIQGDQAENLEMAITACNQALQVYTREAFPQEWAMTQNNLGGVYSNRIRETKAENLEMAIAAFTEALKVYTHEAFPQNHALTLFNLGLPYQQVKQFTSAYATYDCAIDTVESLREEIVSGEESKLKQAEEWNKLYCRMVETCLELSNINQAIEYVERGKTRNLVERILSRDLKTIFPADVVTQLETYRDEIAAGQYQIQNGKAENPQLLAQHLQQLRQQRNDLQNRYLPIGSGFDFEQFQQNLDNHTAVVEFYITGDKLLTFIFTHQTPQPIVLPSEPKDLDKLVKWVVEYLEAYNDHKIWQLHHPKNQTESPWQSHLNIRLHLLAKILHIDEIIQRIPSECDSLILIPHQYLHLLPLHALPINNQQGEAKSAILMDRFPAGVSYTPSCQLLEQVQQRKRPDFQSLFAIQNPTDDLDYTNLEVEVIQSFFQTTEVLASQDASEAAVKVNQNLTTAHCSHFSCHGYFNPESPLESALILAEAKPEQITEDKKIEDGLLTLGEIFGFNLNQCRLVTLSACETGLIDPTNISDEYIGLPSGFLVAGSSAVVSSLWTVNDLSTALLMIKFYVNLHDQMSLAIALNQAQLWLREATRTELTQWIKERNLPLSPTLRVSLFRGLQPDDKPFHEPFHWAAFCSIGQ